MDVAGKTAIREILLVISQKKVKFSKKSSMNNFTLSDHPLGDTVIFC